MNLTITVDSDKLISAFALAGQTVASSLRKTLGEELRQVVRITRTKAAHPTWTSRTGRASRSISSEVSPSGLRGRVFLDEGIALHSVFLHEGTGLWGPSHKKIVPKTAKKLVFKGKNGKTVAVNSVNGIRGDPFLYRTFLERRTKIISEVQKTVNDVLKTVGLI